MPVKISCHQCQQKVQVSRRRAGTFVSCPRCGAGLQVPSEVEVSVSVRERGESGTEENASRDMAGIARGDIEWTESDLAEPPMDVSVVADVPRAVTTPIVGSSAFEVAANSALPTAKIVGIQSRPVEVVPTIYADNSQYTPTIDAPMYQPPVREAPAAAPAAPRSVSRDYPSYAAPRRGAPELNYMLVSRSAIYLQALILALVAGVFFFLGIRTGISRVQIAEEELAAAPKDPVVVQGNIAYVNKEGSLVPDAGASVIILPSAVQPDQRILAHGLRPVDPEFMPRNPGVMSIEALGGGVTRTDGDGKFQLVVPSPGDYYMLLISRHATRKAGEMLVDIQRRELTAYFAAPEDLLGNQKFQWTLQRFSPKMDPFTHEFR